MEPAAEGLLGGRVVAITGAGSGLGRAYALAVAAAGAVVVVNDVDPEAAAATAESISSVGHRAQVVLGSVSEPGFGDQLVDEAIALCGRLDGLVNNAGILSPGDTSDQSDEVVKRTVDVNLLGSLRCGSAALKAMRRQGAGAVVNVVSGALEGLPDLTVYGATKGGMMSATFGWALEVEGTGVRVNAISPLAHTGMSDLSDVDESVKGGSADSVAPMVVYLLSDRSRALNGQIIRFDGRRLGIVAEPRVVAISPSRSWTADGIAAAFEGGMGDRLRRVGLNRATRAEHVD